MLETHGNWKECIDCGDDVHVERWALGYHYCKFCGEDRAKTERESWCVIQEYTKGNYQLVTSTQAHTTLRQTNPKETRL
jgi:ribosomal protein L37AE/L43A